MKISCPNCGITANINETKLPQGKSDIKCKICKHNFTFDNMLPEDLEELFPLEEISEPSSVETHPLQVHTAVDQSTYDITALTGFNVITEDTKSLSKHYKIPWENHSLFKLTRNVLHAMFRGGGSKVLGTLTVRGEAASIPVKQQQQVTDIWHYSKEDTFCGTCNNWEITKGTRTLDAPKLNCEIDVDAVGDCQIPESGMGNGKYLRCNNHCRKGYWTRWSKFE